MKFIKKKIIRNFKYYEFVMIFIKFFKMLVMLLNFFNLNCWDGDFSMKLYKSIVDLNICIREFFV